MSAYNIVNPANLVAGQAENIGDVLANLQAIQAIINGGLDNSNFNAAGALAISKLAGYPTDASKILKGDGTWGGGYTLISQQVLGAPATSVNFGGIPQTFKHLELITSARTDQAATSVVYYLRFNGDGGTNYDYQYTTGNATSVVAAEGLGGAQMIVGWAAASGSSGGHWGRSRILIPDYVPFFHERMVSFESFAKWSAGSGGLINVTGGGSWRSSAAITSITLLANSSTNFAAGSSFSLYGIS